MLSNSCLCILYHLLALAPANLHGQKKQAFKALSNSTSMACSHTPIGLWRLEITINIEESHIQHRKLLLCPCLA